MVHQRRPGGRRDRQRPVRQPDVHRRHDRLHGVCLWCERETALIRMRVGDCHRHDLGDPAADADDQRRRILVRCTGPRHRTFVRTLERPEREHGDTGLHLAIEQHRPFNQFLRCSDGERHPGHGCRRQSGRGIRIHSHRRDARHGMPSDERAVLCVRARHGSGGSDLDG